MARLNLLPGEAVFADVTTPFRTQWYPVVETVFFTGIAAIAFGFLDANPDIIPNRLGQTVISVLWLLLVLGRLVLPVFRARRRRVVVTEHRILVRDAGFGQPVQAIDLDDVAGVERAGKDVALRLFSTRRPFVLYKVPKARRVVNVIEQLTH